MFCVLILYISGGAYSLKSTPNDRFSEKLFMPIFYLLSEFLPDICCEKIVEEILFLFGFLCLAWGSNTGFSSNKPTPYLLDHGDQVVSIALDRLKIIEMYWNPWY